MAYYFLKFADEQSQPVDILGNSRDAKHAGWIEILSFSWGASVPHVTISPGNGNGRSDLPQDLYFTTEDSAASMSISRACSLGHHYPTVVLEAVKDGHAFLKLVMSDVYVATFQSNDGPNGPLYQFSLEAKSVETTRFGQAPTPPPGAPVILRPPSPRRSGGNSIGGKAGAHVRRGR